MAKVTFTFTDVEGAVDFQCDFDPQLPPEDQWEDNLTQAQKIAVHISAIVLPSVVDGDPKECPYKRNEQN
jgi:hypothetical protein